MDQLADHATRLLSRLIAHNTVNPPGNERALQEDAKNYANLLDVRIHLDKLRFVCSFFLCDAVLLVLFEPVFPIAFHHAVCAGTL